MRLREGLILLAQIVVSGVKTGFRGYGTSRLISRPLSASTLRARGRAKPSRLRDRTAAPPAGNFRAAAFGLAVSAVGLGRIERPHGGKVLLVLA